MKRMQQRYRDKRGRLQFLPSKKRPRSRSSTKTVEPTAITLPPSTALAAVFPVLPNGPSQFPPFIVVKHPKKRRSKQPRARRIKPLEEVVDFGLIRNTSYTGVIIDGVYNPLIVNLQHTYPGSFKGVYALKRSRTNERTPNFRLLSPRERRLIASNTNHSNVWLRCDSTGYSDHSRQYTSSDERFGDDAVYTATSYFDFDSFLPEHLRDESVFQDARRLSQQRLAAAVTGARSNINLAQAFAERKQTANLLITTINRIYGAARNLRSGNLNQVFRSLSLDATGYSRQFRSLDSRVKNTPVDKRIANHWLELQFGWKPLLQDFYGSIELLAHHLNTDSYAIKIKGSAKAEGTKRVRSQATDRVIFDRVRHRYMVKLRLDSYGRAAAAQTGIDNPALLAWELLPYSFVVDWFYNVSGYLRKLNAFAGLEFVSGTESIKWQGVVTTQARSISHTSPYLGFSHRVGSSVVTQGSYTRTVINDFPSVVAPKLDLSFSDDLTSTLWKAATSIALIRQLFKK